MARWRLTQKHYLNVPGTEFEYKEQTHSGRQVKRKFAVPLFLDPEDPADCNYNPGGQYRPDNTNTPGEIIVAHEEGAEPRDIIFTGPPTPDMVPLDDEARAISGELAAAWGQAFVGAEGDENGYTGQLLQELTETLNAFNSSAKPSGYTPDPEIADLKSQVKQLMEMNMGLLSAIKGEPTINRRA